MSKSLNILSSIMKSVCVKSPGGVEQLYVDSLTIPIIRNSEVLIKVMSSGVNRMDIMQREGKYPVPPDASQILGVECSGVVEESLSDKFSKGDKVMALVSGGAYSQYVASPDAYCMKIPRKFSFMQAAGIPEVWITAYQLIHFIAEIKEGDNILIHAAASGVGCAAIQLAKLSKANHIIATSRSSGKLDYCKNLGATATITYDDENKFANKVNEITEGKGVDIILDPIGAAYFEENLSVCARDARWVVYGLMGGTQINLNISKLLFKGVSIRTSTLRSRPYEYKKYLIDQFMKTCMEKFEDGTLKASIDAIFPFEKVKEAHRYMETNRNTGKIILDFSDQV
uniref:Zinc binding alcohol dehydrogenase domain containing 2 n=1 Tax=Nephromyces sp. MMRI TaxID=2496275 RepID=A0A3Q8UBY1_9APIC|nr:zinc binding alcohol dehydrogenase domain containing 2 [Nephromyces sp. MMRI]